MTWTMYIYDNTYVHGYEGAERTEFKGGGQSQPANSIYPQNFVTVTPVTRSHAQFVIVINLSKLFSISFFANYNNTVHNLNIVEF